ncbi:hypothetical protein HDU76_009206, partial [Blyttiomyces sp. JEL0837]
MAGRAGKSSSATTSPKNNVTTNNNNNININSTAQHFPPLAETFNAKCYFSGFIYKCNDLSPDGAPLPFPPPPDAPSSPSSAKSSDLSYGGEWAKWWAELWGSTLLLWKVPHTIAASAYYPSPTIEGIMKSEGSQRPNEALLESIKQGDKRGHVRLPIQDSVVEMLQYGYQPLARIRGPPASYPNLPPPPASPLPPIPYDVFLALTTSGSNLFHIAVRSSIAANAWAGAFRLAAFEASRISEHYTLRCLNGDDVRNAWSDFGLTPFKTDTLGGGGGASTNGGGGIHHEGHVMVKLAYGDDWRRLYVVVSNLADPPWSFTTPSGSPAVGKDGEKGGLRKLFGGKLRRKDSQSNMGQSSDSPSPNSSQTNIFLQQIQSAATRRPDVCFYLSIDDYRASKPPLFRFEHIRHVYLDMIGFSSRGGVPSAASNSVLTVKIEGLFALPKSRDKPIPPPREQEVKTFAYSGPGFYASEPWSDIAAGVDGRTPPQHVLITLDPSASFVEACKWVTSTLAAFRLPSVLIVRDKEVRDGHIGLVDGVGGGEVDLTKAVHSARGPWGLLYLQPAEVAGLPMSPETYGEVKARFVKVLEDKVAAWKAGFVDAWAKAVIDGGIAREAYEREEMVSKVVGLVDWLKRTKPEVVEAPLPPTPVTPASAVPVEGVGVASAAAAAAVTGDVVVENGDGPPSANVVRQSMVGSVKSWTGSSVNKDSSSEQADKASQLSGNVARALPTTPVSTNEVTSPTTNGNVNGSSPPAAALPAPPVDVQPTDLVLVAVPTMLPDGTWIWQYQFANPALSQQGGATGAAQVPPGAQVIASAPGVKVGGVKKDVAKDTTEGETGDEETSDQDGDESEGSTEESKGDSDDESDESGEDESDGEGEEEEPLNKRMSKLSVQGGVGGARRMSMAGSVVGGAGPVIPTAPAGLIDPQQALLMLGPNAAGNITPVSAQSTPFMSAIPSPLLAAGVIPGNIMIAPNGVPMPLIPGMVPIGGGGKKKKEKKEKKKKVTEGVE